MAIGLSLIVIAVGAVARYAIADQWSAVDIPTVGLILMIVGIAGLVIALAQLIVTERSRQQRRRSAEQWPAQQQPPQRRPPQ